MEMMIICGSINEPSHTKTLAAGLADALSGLRVPSVTWDLRAQPLPIADPAFHHKPELHPDPLVRRFIQVARNVDGFALASPLYHGSFSGVLKNAIDHLWWDAFRDKPVALLAHGGSERRSANVNTALQSVVTTLCGYSLQTQIATGPSDFHKNDQNQIELSNNGIKERLDRQAEELVRLARLFRSQKPA